jgi:hypothetical protein
MSAEYITVDLLNSEERADFLAPVVICI